MTTPLPRYYTMAEAADRLRVSRRTLQKIIAAKPCYLLIGRKKLARAFCEALPDA
jgi:predicted DNA-binding protein (UPF0251 family)